VSKELPDTWEAVERRYPRQRRTSEPLFLFGLTVLAVGLLVFFYLPQSKRAGALESSLLEARRLLATSPGTGSGPWKPGLEAAEEKLTEIKALRQTMAARTEFYPDLDRILANPFRVLEFEQRRFTVYRNLLRLADARQSRLPANFEAVIPAYEGAQDEPENTWFQLEFFSHVVETLLRSARNIEIDTIEKLPLRYHEQINDEGELVELRFRIVARGRLENMGAFLNSSAGFSVEADKKSPNAAYFIEQVSLRSASGGANARIEMDLQVSGFASIRGED